MTQIRKQKIKIKNQKLKLKKNSYYQSQKMVMVREHLIMIIELQIEEVKGIIGIVNSQRNGNVSSSFPVFEGDQILISTNKGRVIRTAVKEIRIAGRNTQGVRIIKLTGDEKVVSAIKLDDNLI